MRAQSHSEAERVRRRKERQKAAAKAQKGSPAVRIALVGGAAVLIAVFTWRPGSVELVAKPKAQPRANAPTTDEPAPIYIAPLAADLRPELEGLLRRFGAAHDTLRARLVHGIRERQQDLEKPLLRILAEGNEAPADLLVPAIGVVGWLRLWQAENDLVGLLDEGPSEVRAAAIRALNRLDWWRADRLEARLRSHIKAQTQDIECLLALLEVAATADKPPAALILPLLDHADARVREAAAATFDESQDHQTVAELAAFADAAEGIKRIDALRLLGRLEANPARDESLLRALASDDWTQRQASLQALMKGDTQLRDASAVWQRIEDKTASVTEQVHALTVLELRNQVDAPRLVARLPGMHPVVKLHGARCLVRAGVAEGVTTLIGLLDTVEGPGVDDEDMNCAREESRRILTELAGDDLGSGCDGWLQWHRRNTKLRPYELKRSPRLAW